MSAPGFVSGRNLVIASVQATADYTPLFFVGDEIVIHRPNGGDLMIGDIFYNTETEIMYIWTGTEWAVTGGPGVFDDILDRLNKLEEALASGIIDSGDSTT